MRALINTAIAMIATTGTAFAAGANAEQPGILCWAFLGICGAIFLCQLVPAAMMWIGAVKALATKPAEVHTKG